MSTNLLIVLIILNFLLFTYPFIYSSNYLSNNNNKNKLNVFEGSDLLNPNNKNILKEFFSSNDIRSKPIINVVNHVVSEPAFSNNPNLATSFELYATPLYLHDLVISQIANFIRNDRSIIYTQACYSAIFSSLDNLRLVHAIGWKKNNNIRTTEQNFNEFRKRSGLAADGLPLDMKENTHLYIPNFSDPVNATTSFNQLVDLDNYNYPLFAFDYLTTRLVDSEIDTQVNNLLKELVSNEEIFDQVDNNIDRYIYTSSSKLVNLVISTYNNELDFINIRNNKKYNEILREVNKYAASGSVQDRIDKSSSSKLYRLVNLYIP